MWCGLIWERLLEDFHLKSLSFEEVLDEKFSFKLTQHLCHVKDAMLDVKALSFIFMKNLFQIQQEFEIKI